MVISRAWRAKGKKIPIFYLEIQGGRGIMMPTNNEPPSISPCCQLFLPTYLTSTLRVSSNGWDNTTCVDLSSISSRHVIQRSFRGCLGDWFFSWLSCVCALVFMNTVASLFSVLEPSPEDTHSGGGWNTERST
jgi:hypothetical protein